MFHYFIDTTRALVPYSIQASLSFNIFIRLSVFFSACQQNFQHTSTVCMCMHAHLLVESATYYRIEAIEDLARTNNASTVSIASYSYEGKNTNRHMTSSCKICFAPSGLRHSITLHMALLYLVMRVDFHYFDSSRGKVSAV